MVLVLESTVDYFSKWSPVSKIELNNSVNTLIFRTFSILVATVIFILGNFILSYSSDHYALQLIFDEFYFIYYKVRKTDGENAQVRGGRAPNF